MRIAGAVDIGGTKILAGIADETGKILAGRSFPTVTGEGGALKSTAAIADTLRQQCASLGLAFDALAGVGIVCAGPVNPVSGVVENPYTLPGWDGYPIAENLRRMTGPSWSRPSASSQPSARWACAMALRWAWSRSQRFLTAPRGSLSSRGTD